MKTYGITAWHIAGDGLPETPHYAKMGGLSIDAAREIARALSSAGSSVRLWSESEDYHEAYRRGQRVRRGTFADTTIVVQRAR